MHFDRAALLLGFLCSTQPGFYYVAENHKNETKLVRMPLLLSFKINSCALIIFNCIHVTNLNFGGIVHSSDTYTCTCKCITRAHPAMSHCNHLLLKCRMATNISQWLKVQSRSFCENVYFDQLLDFPMLQLLFLHILLLCHILL